MSEQPKADYQPVTEREPIPMRLCDDEGMVSDNAVNDPLTPRTLDGSYLARHNRLRGMTRRGLAPQTEPFFCTGSAHLAHEVFTCTSPAHLHWRFTTDDPVAITSAAGTARVEEIVQRRATERDHDADGRPEGSAYQPLSGSDGDDG